MTVLHRGIRQQFILQFTSILRLKPLMVLCPIHFSILYTAIQRIIRLIKPTSIGLWLIVTKHIKNILDGGVCIVLHLLILFILMHPHKYHIENQRQQMKEETTKTYNQKYQTLLRIHTTNLALQNKIAQALFSKDALLKKQALLLQLTHRLKSIPIMRPYLNQNAQLPKVLPPVKLISNDKLSILQRSKEDSFNHANKNKVKRTILKQQLYNIELRIQNKIFYQKQIKQKIQSKKQVTLYAPLQSIYQSLYNESTKLDIPLSETPSLCSMKTANEMQLQLTTELLGFKKQIQNLETEIRQKYNNLFDTQCNHFTPQLVQSTLDKVQKARMRVNSLIQELSESDSFEKEVNQKLNSFVRVHQLKIEKYRGLLKKIISAQNRALNLGEKFTNFMDELQRQLNKIPYKNDRL